MSSNEATRAAAARMPADFSGRDAAHSLAGLLGVLDRADELLVRRGPQPRRSVAHRPDAYRRGSARRIPLRPVPQAPRARPTPGEQLAAATPAVRTAAAARGWRALTRRAALWGAGPDGAYLAWRGSAPMAPRGSAPMAPCGGAPAAPRGNRPAAQQAGAPAAGRRSVSRLRRLTRRLALWGAGPQGEYLAWGSPPRPRDSRPDADRPVVLHELPSTPTIQPAASSPVAALLPRGPASSADPQGARPVAPRAVPVPGIRPRGRLERTGATGWPSPARLSPAATGLVRARGDPVACPVRGSPLPARRSRSPGSERSSFPHGPPRRS